MNLLFCYLINQRRNMQTCGIMWTKIAIENVTGHFATIKSIALYLDENWISYLWSILNCLFVAHNLHKHANTSSVHAWSEMLYFSLEKTKAGWSSRYCFIKVMKLYLALFRGEFIFINSLSFFPPQNLCSNGVPGRCVFILF